MTDYKNYNFNSFKRFATDLIDKKYKGKFFYSDIKEQIKSILEGETSKLSAKSFYKVVLVLDEDLDKLCKQFFKDHPAFQLNSLENLTNKMQGLFRPMINSKKQLSEASGIKETRLGEVFDERFEEMYSYEVYGLATAAGLEPSQLFEYFYGDGPRPIVGV